ncbi:MAG: sn-glycerol-1-phosphate dehydrogenase [Clostridia bacterium]|nr:sn-glycerol-1-phosphate dehydrogenase [Clostridia bacterium]
MNINEILKGVECTSCGKVHKCPIESVFVEENAILRLLALCQKYNKILLVADENTYAVAGETTEKILNERILRQVIFSGKTVLIPNEEAIATVTKSMDNIDLILGIGSGVIQDLCKYVSHFSKIPYMIVATAPSMDGYASTGSAMILKGMKETVPAGLPLAIIADTGVLKNAPMEMIKAGYGDIIGKYSALNDWRLSSVVNGEYFCQYIYDITYEMIKKTLSTAGGLLKRDEKSIRALAEALIVVGIMMSFATTSRPASGSEHHLSHFFEITGIVKNEPYFAHGVDVAYSTVITADIRKRLLEKPFPSVQYKEDKASYLKNMQDAYKEVASGCIALQERLGTYNRDRLSIYKSKETEIRKILEEMPSPIEIEQMLALVELDIKEFYALYGKEKLEKAIKYAKDLKDRYTVLWLNYDLLEN